MGVHMRRARLTALAVLAAVWSTAAAPAMAMPDSPKVAGDWEGVLKVAPGAELRIIIHVKEEKGALSASMESPDQGAGSISADSASLKDGKLALEIKKIRG